MPRALTASCARSGAEAFVLGTAVRAAAQVGSRAAAGLRWWRWWSTAAGPHDG